MLLHFLITPLQRYTVMAIPSSPPPAVTADQLHEWFTDALPDDLYEGDLEVLHDADEIIVSGDIGPPGKGLTDEQQIVAFREATRDARMEVAEKAQAVFRRRVSWGASCGELKVRFTTVNAPAMTRLRLEDRQILDTLIEGGVARSRSEALAWCVRLVAQHEADWIAELRDATESIRTVREKGPGGAQAK